MDEMVRMKEAAAKQEVQKRVSCLCVDVWTVSQAERQD
jgi:hypothetical protein